jgi:hypothetical protein
MNPLVASPGDHLIIAGHRVGEAQRDGEILEVRGKDGGPPYLVRWMDTGQEGLMFPSSDAKIRHYDRAGPG